MKDFWKSWKFWTAVAAVVLTIIGVILYIYVPEIKDFIKSVGICIGCILAGFIGGYYVGKFVK